MAVYYSSKALRVWAETQVTEGTPIAATVFATTNAIAMLEPEFSLANTTENAEYYDSETVIDGFTELTDRTMEISGGIFMPALSEPGIGDAPSEVNFPLEKLFACAGTSITYSGTGATSKVALIKDASSTDKLTIMASAVSADSPTLHKCFRAFDAYTSFDLEMIVGKKAKFKAMLKGTPVDWAPVAEAFPQEETVINPDYGIQKTFVAGNLRSATLIQAHIVKFGSKAFNTGADDLPTPFSSTVKNFCFQKASFPNLFGFNYERSQTSCRLGFDRVPVISDFSISILEEDLAGVIQSDTMEQNVTDPKIGLMDFCALALRYGVVGGSEVYLQFDKLQLVDSKNAVIGAKKAKELSFKGYGLVHLHFAV